MENTGIKETVLEAIRACAQSGGLEKVVLFGSRARGTHREKSDIDLALFGGNQMAFVLNVEDEAPTLLEFDFVDMDGAISEELAARVASEGVVLYEKV